MSREDYRLTPIKLDDNPLSVWIEDQCRHKKVDWKEDVIYMYYRDLVK